MTTYGETDAGARRRDIDPDAASVVLRFFAEVWNERGAAARDAAAELVADDYRDHDPVPQQGPGRDGVAASIARCHTQIPDLRVLVDELIVDGDRVAARWTAVGTHTGEVLGVAPTGRPFRATGIDIFRLRHGRIAEAWHAWDQAGLREQLTREITPTHQGETP